MIDEKKLIAEIERRVAEYRKQHKAEGGAYLCGKYAALEDLLPFIGFLKVKEVNIEKQESDLPKWKKGGIAGGHWSGEAYVSQGRKPQLVYETMHIDVNELVKKLPKEDGV